MVKTIHKNPVTQYHLIRLHLASIMATTFAELDQINRQIRKDNIAGRVA